MKNLNTILRKANLTPLERVTVLVHNDIHKEKTGTEILSKSELHALTQGWKSSMAEANEYNRYLEIMHLERSMRIDARMHSYYAELAIARNMRVLSYYLADMKTTKATRHTEEMMKGLTEAECIKFATTHTYFEYRDTLHTFTFDNLPEDVQEDLLLLDEASAYSKQYLEDEIRLYNIYKDGNPTRPDKDTLVDMIFSRMYYEGIKNIRGGNEKDCFMIGGFFAGLPFKEVMNKVAHDAGIAWKDQEEEDLLKDIEKYSVDRNVTIQQLVKDTLKSWLDDGLFTKDYPPLFASERFDTWNGNTKKKHSELFAIWHTEFEKSTKYLEDLFNTRKLTKQKITISFLGEKEVEIITGESLYACMENLRFVNDYKRQVDTLLRFSNVALFIEKYAKPIRNHATLCEFRRMAKKASDTFDADFTEDYDKLIESYKSEIDLLNHELRTLTDRAMEYLYRNEQENIKYDIHIINGGFHFDLKEQTKASEIAQKYNEEFEKLFKG